MEMKISYNISKGHERPTYWKEVVADSFGFSLAAVHTVGFALFMLITTPMIGISHLYYDILPLGLWAMWFWSGFVEPHLEIKKPWIAHEVGAELMKKTQKSIESIRRYEALMKKQKLGSVDETLKQAESLYWGIISVAASQTEVLEKSGKWNEFTSCKEGWKALEILQQLEKETERKYKEALEHRSIVHIKAQEYGSAVDQLDGVMKSVQRRRAEEAADRQAQLQALEELRASLKERGIDSQNLEPLLTRYERWQPQTYGTRAPMSTLEG